MFQRLIACALVATFAAILSAGVLACDGMRGEIECCCAPATGTVAGSDAAGCCGMACGGATEERPAPPARTGDEPLVAAHTPPASQPPPAATAPAVSVPVALKAVEATAASHVPPDLFLQTAAFLI